MARRKGIRKSQDNNVHGMPGATPFTPMNGAGPGQRDPRSAGQDGQGFFFGGPGGQHNAGTGQARPQDIYGGKTSRPKPGEPGMSYAGGTPGFYDEGGPGAPGKVYEGGELPQVGYPGGGNGARPQPTPGPGGRPAPGRGRGARPQPPQFGGGQPPRFAGGQPPQFGGDMNYTY